MKNAILQLVLFALWLTASVIITVMVSGAGGGVMLFCAALAWSDTSKSIERSLKAERNDGDTNER